MHDDAKKPSSGSGHRFEEFAGSESCRNCHKDIYESHLQTFHHQTSALASTETIKGSFDPGRNTFYYNPELYIAAEKKDSQLFQTAYQRGVAKISRPFDFVIGSGKRGQTFLYWHDNYIFQLPISYFTSTNEWTNSPGYSNKVQFNRPVTSRCLECHSTYFQQELPSEAKADKFSRSNIILGVECESCHGPAADHVAFQQKNPKDTTGQLIISLSKLSRTQTLDQCRFCHGGRLNKTMPSFSFTAGDKLSDYFKTDSTLTDISDIDVHGNQYGMLKASKCFELSAITCTSCHDPHRNQTGQSDIFARKCMDCHTGAGNKLCKLTGSVVPGVLVKNCIDCHMPELPSKTIMVLRQGETIPTSAYMRSHYISVYPDEAKKIVDKINEKK